MVSEAQRSRAPIQRLADVVAGWFVPLVVVVAIVTFIVWAAVGPEPRFAYALVNAIAVLIIACPCALGLATPMSIMVGTGRGAEAGVLFRNAEALELLERMTTLVVDKTGTLTEGKPRLATCGASGALRRDDAAAARGEPRKRERASPCRGDRCRGARAKYPVVACAAVRVEDGQRRCRASGRAFGGDRKPEVPRGARGGPRPRSGRAPKNCGSPDRRLCSRSSTASSQDWSASPIR